MFGKVHRFTGHDGKGQLGARVGIADGINLEEDKSGLLTACIALHCRKESE